MLNQTQNEINKTSTTPWWREAQVETQTTEPFESTIIVAPDEDTVMESEIAPDVWAELEAEAARRMELVQESVVLTVDKSARISKWRKQFLLMMLPLAALATVPNVWLFLQLSSSENPIGFRFFNLFITMFLWLEILFLYFLMPRIIARQKPYKLSVSPLGIGIELPMMHIELIRWDEIAEIKKFWMMEKYIGFVLKDFSSVVDRMDGSSAVMAKINEFCVRWIYRPLRIPVSSIFFPLSDLPMSEEELMATIERYRAKGQSNNLT